MASRDASTLVVAEHNGDSVTPITYNALTASREVGGDIATLVVGEDCSNVRVYFCMQQTSLLQLHESNSVAVFKPRVL